MRWGTAVAAVCGAVWLSGCGLRSDPLFEGGLIGEGGEDDPDDDSGDDPGDSACASPIVMPPQNVTIEGVLGGRGNERGWCGQDAGPEQVYSLTTPGNTDVTLVVRSSEVPLTLRIVEDGCADGSGKTVVCANDFVEESRHFLARAGSSYSIIVDSDNGASGKYSFDVVFGWPTLDQCTFQEEVIIQQPGGSFAWFNEFGAGQGRADGFCGGPGQENIFAIETSYVGAMSASLIGSNGFEGVLSLRTNCAGVSELACSAAVPNGSTDLDTFIEAPGSGYYLAVDQVGTAGGAYSLFVFFE